MKKIIFVVAIFLLVGSVVWAGSWTESVDPGAIGSNFASVRQETCTPPPPVIIYRTEYKGKYWYKINMSAREAECTETYVCDHGDNNVTVISTFRYYPSLKDAKQAQKEIRQYREDNYNTCKSFSDRYKTQDFLSKAKWEEVQ
jgi:hypothetical protein